ncbi:evolutionarily conserved signaling intermediate in Toll pathway, mitochondrial-like isoform X3 [Biomphalaria glabrata]|uniref:Evolutionarily conserved signaling intermediate in Toll pathway, mitochondrial n=1 Tax=Biomphalaria glabrata TaxID=6526 RepID=A0A9W2ZKZ3_BIOGL|nr:evolutionarily conserved signaling intermediate in Toll pathway, mitochondrial-like isoform X3 [Biomphalaria glabrata]
MSSLKIETSSKKMLSLPSKLMNHAIAKQPLKHMLSKHLLAAEVWHKRTLSSKSNGITDTNLKNSVNGKKSVEMKQEPTLSSVDKARQMNLKNQVIDSSLPNHDPQRITSESRKLEVKAKSLLKQIANEKGTDKAAFLYAINTYISQETLYRRGAVEFIYSAMHEMKTFGVNRDLTAYKALLQVFPEGKMIPRNIWQVEFMHYPRQQQCGIDMLEQMEVNGVIPDDEFGVLLKNRFGSTAHVTRKYLRMMYWLPKFKNINPYPIPYILPTDPIQIALFMLKRMCVDQETKYSVLKTTELEENSTQEDTYIVSAQSPIQQELLSKHNCNLPLFVEGPYPVYLRYLQKHYFLLRAEPNIKILRQKKQQEIEEEKEKNMFEWINFFDEDYKSIKPVVSVHEQEDSTILALCITGTCSKSSVQTWIRWLEKSNPNLTTTPVLFKLLSEDHEMEVIGDNRAFQEQST